MNQCGLQFTSVWKQRWESLNSYFYLKLAKTLCLSYYLLCFLFNKIEDCGAGPAWKLEFGGMGSEGEVAPTMYTHVSKCKNDKIKGKTLKFRFISIYKPIHFLLNSLPLYPLPILPNFI
jgi:hypothetical protein